ncbi:MAG: hypothetical protein QOK48_22 [Blastocatellia bacterium]|jgi:hypothetical protein|nr:hypothetical protein [Blastocatellia bacterium]
MTDDFISKAARLMAEQASDYPRLDAACVQLTDALIHGDPAAIESITRIGDAVLHQMRARLVRIIQSLTAFADCRASALEKDAPRTLDPEARAEFESASNNLMLAANEFQRTRFVATALTTSGATYAAACIQGYGIQPTTYRGPYARGEARSWA